MKYSEYWQLSQNSPDLDSLEMEILFPDLHNSEKSDILQIMQGLKEEAAHKISEYSELWNTCYNSVKDSQESNILFPKIDFLIYLHIFDIWRIYLGDILPVSCCLK